MTLETRSPAKLDGDSGATNGETRRVASLPCFTTELHRLSRRRRAAVERALRNPTLRECVTIEPHLIPILRPALLFTGWRWRYRHNAYIELRNEASWYVGDLARDERLKTSAHYDAVIAVIGEAPE